MKAITGVLVVVLSVTLSIPGRAQAGKGLVDPNVAGERDLLALPSMTAAIVKGLLDKRPFMSPIDLQAFLVAQKLTPSEIADFYRKAFVQIDLNAGSPEELALIPAAAKNALDEIVRSRPWKNWAQFRTTIGKAAGQAESDRLAMYLFIPINLNTATDEDILSIPGAGRSMVREFKEYRPWRSKAQFDKEIGKYVGPKETARLWRYVVIQ
jgi:DNA uptake protein ComE-like DNA-binding protein